MNHNPSHPPTRLRHIMQLAVFALVLASLLLTACAVPAQTTPEPTNPPVIEPTQPPAPTTKPVEPTKTPEPTKPPVRKVATFIWTQEFDSLNPLYTNMWFSSVTQQIWNCWAWDFDDKNNAMPVLVKEIPSTQNGGISADGKTITLKLRDGIVWSDGQPITADDFVFTYQMTVDPKNKVATTSPYDLMESVTAPDKTTVVSTFKDPYAPWLGVLWRGIIPAHVLKPVFDKDGTIDNAEWNRAPTVSCGPFNFDKWESGSYARFVANEKYWLGRPKLDEIFFRFVPDDASMIAALKNKEGDLGTFFSYSDLGDLEKAGLTIYKVFSGYNEGIYINLRQDKGHEGHPALQDQQVRQAIVYAIDRASLVKNLLLGRTEVAATYWDNMPANDPSLKPYPSNPEKANQLLDSAGWVDSNGDGTRDKGGVELVLRYGTTTRQIRQDTQAYLQQQLAAVGIKVDLFTYAYDTYFADYANNGPAAQGQLDLFEYSTNPHFPDPDTFEWLCKEIPTDANPSGVNWTGVCDEELNGLFEQQATQVDPAQRLTTFHKITRLIFDKVYFFGLWQDPDLWGVSSRLTGIKISGATSFFNIREWDMAP